MPDEQRNNEERTEEIIAYLGDLWKKYSFEPSSDTLKRITAFVANLPEQYKAMGLKAIATYLVNTMSLHYLDIMATFQQKAEAEGIDAEEVAATFADVLPESFQTMMELSHHVTVQSLDNLVTLSNITVGLHGFGRPRSADDAQDLVYSLPELYWHPLVAKHLVVNIPIKPDQAAAQSANFTSLNTPKASVIYKSSSPGKTRTEDLSGQLGKSSTLEVPTIFEGLSFVV